MNTMHVPPREREATGAASSDTWNAPEVDAVRSEPVWRVVGGSLAAGLVAAVVLTLGVFGGAPEHVITGVALLAFAGGWAMLAVASRRFLRVSQRWAWIPAAWMAFAGSMLVVARPGDRSLDRAGWVWPPMLAALAVWMFVRIRRSLAGRVRLLLYPVVATLVVSSVGGLYETVVRVHDRRTHPAPGALIDIGGRRLHLDCTGAGGPTVVLESGLGGTSANWARITTEIRSTTRVCAYDRAGQGWSEDVDAPQDGAAIASDLHALLSAAGEPGPYVMVGHSAGGPYVMTYAAAHPDDVAGMVLLDAMSPDEFTELPGFASEQSMMRRGLGVLPSLARVGVARVLPASIWSSLPEPQASQVRAFASSPRGMRNMRDEQSMYPTVFRQAKALASLGSKPLVVVAASASLDEHAEWMTLQSQLAALSSDSRLRVADSSHAGLVDDVRASEVSVDAISDVVRALRTGQPLPQR